MLIGSLRFYWQTAFLPSKSKWKSKINLCKPIESPQMRESMLLAGESWHAAAPFRVPCALNGKACSSEVQRICHRQSLPVARQGVDGADSFLELLPGPLPQIRKKLHKGR